MASSSLYGGTYNLLSVTLPRHGITTTFVDPSDPENFQKATQENTRAIFVESLGNPKLDVLDLKAIAAYAKAALAGANALRLALAATFLYSPLIVLSTALAAFT